MQCSSTDLARGDLDVEHDEPAGLVTDWIEAFYPDLDEDSRGTRVSGLGVGRGENGERGAAAGAAGRLADATPDPTDLLGERGAGPVRAVLEVNPESLRLRGSESRQFQVSRKKVSTLCLVGWGGARTEDLLDVVELAIDGGRMRNGSSCEGAGGVVCGA